MKDRLFISTKTTQRGSKRKGSRWGKTSNNRRRGMWRRSPPFQPNANAGALGRLLFMFQSLFWGPCPNMCVYVSFLFTFITEIVISPICPINLTYLPSLSFTSFSTSNNIPYWIKIATPSFFQMRHKMRDLPIPFSGFCVRSPLGESLVIKLLSIVDFLVESKSSFV